MATLVTSPSMTPNVAAAANNVFLAQIDRPVWEAGLINLFPQYFQYENLRNYFMGEEGITQPDWYYEQLNRTTATLTVDTIVSGGGTPTVVFDSTDTDATYGQKAVEQMTFMLNDSSTIVRISATPTYTAGNWRYTVTTIDGSNITTATQMAVSSPLLPIGSALDSSWTMPDPLHWSATRLTNQCSVIGSTLTWGGIEAAKLKWINNTEGKPTYWYTQEQVIQMANHFNSIMKADHFNIYSGSNTGVISGDGMIPIISQYGTDMTYTGAATIQDVNDMASQLAVYSPSKKFLVYCGQEFMNGVMADILPTLKYGAVDFGPFAQFSSWGVKAPKVYVWGDIEIYFQVSPIFTDPQMQNAVSGSPQFSNYSMWIALDNLANGTPSIQRKYVKTNEGADLKYLVKENPGMFPSGYGATFNQLATSRSSQNERYVLSVIGLHTSAGQHHGILRGA